MSQSNKLRIVSLLPSATEIVAALGLTEALVGRSHECDYPPEVKQLPICTEARIDATKPSVVIDADIQTLLQATLSIYQIKTDVLKKLKPTHIITQDLCDVCAVNFVEVQKAMNQLTDSNPEIISLQPNQLSDIWQDLQKVAQTLGVDPQPILDRLHSRIDFCQQKVKSLPNYKIPTVAAIEWVEPLMIAGNWIPELIQLAGGKCLFNQGGKNSTYLAWEKILTADPDYLIVMPCGFDLERTKRESQTLKENPYWSNLQAVRQNQVLVADGNAYFNRPSQRLVDSLEILAEMLHPKLFNFGYRGFAWDYLK